MDIHPIYQSLSESHVHATEGVKIFYNTHPETARKAQVRHEVNLGLQEDGWSTAVRLGTVRGAWRQVTGKGVHIYVPEDALNMGTGSTPSANRSRRSMTNELGLSSTQIRLVQSWESDRSRCGIVDGHRPSVETPRTVA